MARRNTLNRTIKRMTSKPRDNSMIIQGAGNYVRQVAYGFLDGDGVMGDFNNDFNTDFLITI